MDWLLIPLYALITALLCYMVEYGFREGELMHWWIRIINKLPDYLYKPLGGCIICFGFWLSLALFVLLQDNHSIWAIIAFISINHFLLRKLADVE